MRSSAIRAISAVSVAIALASCQWLARDDESLTTDTYSSAFQTLQDKQDFIYRYISSELKFEDIKFHVWYVDNSGGWIPGPSDYRIEVLARVEPAHLERWLVDLQEKAELDADWADDTRLEGLGCSHDISKIYASKYATKMVGICAGGDCISVVWRTP